MEDNQSELRIHQFLPRSYSNGPGARAVVWTQGCSLKCPGCFNPETHSFEGGEVISIRVLFEKIFSLKNTIEGVTISGGEPLEQANSLCYLLDLIKKNTHLSIIILTGYEWDEITALAKGIGTQDNFPGKLREHADGVRRVLELADVIIAGRYKHSLRLAKQLRGSSNKTVHCLTNRYSSNDFEDLPEAEIIIDPAGKLTITGIKPPKIKF